jgi:hypothetical protein
MPLQGLHRGGVDAHSNPQPSKIAFWVDFVRISDEACIDSMCERMCDRTSDRLSHARTARFDRMFGRICGARVLGDIFVCELSLQLYAAQYALKAVLASPPPLRPEFVKLWDRTAHKEL